MRPVFALAVVLATRTVACAAEESVTVLLDFAGPHPAEIVNAMQDEATNLVRPLSVDLDWRLRSSETPFESSNRLLVGRFRGSCTADAPKTRRPPSRAPLGSAHLSDGSMLPFADIDCGTIHAYISRNNSVPPSGKAFGRALGRVLAHELTHVLEDKRNHDSSGVMRESVSASYLVESSTFSFSSRR